MTARLVPWSIVGLSLVVLGALVVLNPYLPASPASVSSSTPLEAPQQDSWIIGAGLIGTGSAIALVAMLRERAFG